MPRRWSTPRHSVLQVVLTTGMGKSAIVAQRLAASLRSISTSASYIHGAEWSHGDLGVLNTRSDCGVVVIGFSHSGNTAEIVELGRHIRRHHDDRVRLVGVTGTSDCALNEVAHLLLVAPVPCEAEPFGIVPAASILAQEAVCNALVRGIIQSMGMTVSDFHRNHPTRRAVGSNAKRHTDTR